MVRSTVNGVLLLLSWLGIARCYYLSNPISNKFSIRKDFHRKRINTVIFQQNEEGEDEEYIQVKRPTKKYIPPTHFDMENALPYIKDPVRPTDPKDNNITVFDLFESKAIMNMHNRRFQPSANPAKYKVERELNERIRFGMTRRDNFWNVTYANHYGAFKHSGNNDDDYDEYDEYWQHSNKVSMRRRIHDIAHTKSSYLASIKKMPNYVPPSSKLDQIRINLLEGAEEMIHTMNLDTSPKDRKKLIQKEAAYERKGLSVYLPKRVQKVIDYILFLRKPPTKGELQRNLFVAVAFAAVAASSTRSRRPSLLYLGIYNVFLVSFLVSRGQPVKEDAVGGRHAADRPSYSFDAWRAAILLTIAGAASSYIAVLGVLSIFEGARKIAPLAAMIASIIGNAIFTLNFEVYESKEQSGLRWKLATSQNSAQSNLERYSEEAMTSGGEFDVKSEMDYYPANVPNPERVEDWNLSPYKYQDEEDYALGKRKRPFMGDRELKRAEHYKQWRVVLKRMLEYKIDSFDKLKPYLKLVDNEAFFKFKASPMVETVVNFMTKKRGEKKKPRKEKIKVVSGPKYYREAMPGWLRAIGGEFVYITEKDIIEQVRRQFGTYRKGMYKKDPMVTLLPCDGVTTDIMEAHNSANMIGKKKKKGGDKKSDGDAEPSN